MFFLRKAGMLLVLRWKAVMILFGIDPGSVYTGFGVVEVGGAAQIRHVDSGRICCGNRSFDKRLGLIYDGLTSLMQLHNPQCVVIEQLFVHKNVMSALKLGHARGVSLLAAAQTGARIVEYTPRQVKKALTGYGAAQKEQVGYMVKMILGLPGEPASDAADALALAITYANAQRAERALTKEIIP